MVYLRSLCTSLWKLCDFFFFFLNKLINSPQTFVHQASLTEKPGLIALRPVSVDLGTKMKRKRQQPLFCPRCRDQPPGPNGFQTFDTDNGTEFVVCNKLSGHHPEHLVVSCRSATMKLGPSTHPYHWSVID